jgi:hypothetical protein
MEEAGLVLELSDQKSRGFLVYIVFTRWFLLDSAYKVFGKMSVRT